MNDLRNRFLATAAIIAVSGSAYAADLPVKAPPLPLPVPASTWQGGYIGGLVGGGQDGTKCSFLGTTNTTSTIVPCGGQINPGTAASINSTTAGFLAGGQAGWDWQSSSFVYGVAADWTWTNFKRSALVNRAGTTINTLSTDVNWLASFRGRVGWAFDDIKTLVYATGGLALGHIQNNAGWRGDLGGTSQAWNASSEGIKTGWVAGGGVEHKLTKNLSILAEALYYDLGNSTGTGRDSGGSTYTTGFSHKEIVGRVGMNWRF